MTMTAPAPTGLASRLRAATAQVHRDAENTGFVTDLLEGRLSLAAHADLTRQLRVVYGALERLETRIAGTPIGAALIRPELSRVAALDADLAVLDPDAAIDVVPAAAAYAAHLDASDELGYVAHAYTRYLGDLSGGQIIRRMVQRHYGAPDAAVGFYVFEGIEKLPPYKDAYRATLDTLPLDEAQAETVAREAVTAFGLNSAVFAALGARHG